MVKACFLLHVNTVSKNDDHSKNTMKMISKFKKGNVFREMFRDAMSSHNN